MVDKRLKTKQRRESIWEEIREKGIWNITQSELAKKHGISPQQIHKDMKVIYKRGIPTDIDKVAFELGTGQKKALKQMYTIMLNAQDPRTRVQAAKAFSDMAKIYTSFLESYNLKDKVADKQEITLSKKEVLKELLEDGE